MFYLQSIRVGTAKENKDMTDESKDTSKSARKWDNQRVPKAKENKDMTDESKDTN